MGKEKFYRIPKKQKKSQQRIMEDSEHSDDLDDTFDSTPGL
jgi:hypothetical protein